MSVLSCNHPLEITHTDGIHRIQHYWDFLGNMYCFPSQPAAIVCRSVDLVFKEEKRKAEIVSGQPKTESLIC